MAPRFLSYAQELEDFILSEYLSDISNGFYVDIGANDPWELSVTKYFYNHGWSGINIDPEENCIKELDIDRPRDINLLTAVGDSNGEVCFYHIGVNTLSTANKEVALIAKKDGYDVSETSVPITTLTSILDTYLMSTDIHFCKIDVEGFEKEVISGIDFSKYRPWLLCIESTEPRSNQPSYEKWERYLFDADYEFLFEYKFNRYYCSKEHNEFMRIDMISRMQNTKIYCLSPVDSNHSYNSKKGLKALIKDIPGYLFRTLNSVRGYI